MSVCSASLGTDPPPLLAEITAPVWAAEMSQFGKDLLIPAPSNLLQQGWDQPPAMSRSSTTAKVLSRRVNQTPVGSWIPHHFDAAELSMSLGPFTLDFVQKKQT